MRERTKEKIREVGGMVTGIVFLVTLLGLIAMGLRECMQKMEARDPTDKQVCEALCDQMVKARPQDSTVPVECWRDGCLEACGCAALGHLELPCAEMPVPPCFDPDKNVLIHESLRELIELKRKEMSPR